MKTFKNISPAISFMLMMAFCWEGAFIVLQTPLTSGTRAPQSCCQEGHCCCPPSTCQCNHPHNNYNTPTTTGEILVLRGCTPSSEQLQPQATIQLAILRRVWFPMFLCNTRYRWQDTPQWFSQLWIHDIFRPPRRHTPIPYHYITRSARRHMC